MEYMLLIYSDYSRFEAMSAAQKADIAAISFTDLSDG